MTPPRNSLSRWLAPVAVLAVVLSVAGVRASVAGAAPALPGISATALLAKVAQTKVEALSGVVHTSTDLGLPALPDTGGALSPQALLAGRHTLRVFLAGPERQRVDLLGTLAETTFVHAGRDAWQWSSSTNKATHTLLPAPAAGGHEATSPVGTPQALAAQLLAAVDPTTEVTVGTAATVAGRSAYDLRLSPTSKDSLVERADLYVDAENGLPLRVTILARNTAHPAVDVGFDSIDLRTPPARIFSFAAPAGAKVTQAPLPQAQGGTHHDAMQRPPAAGAQPVVRGTGWTSVVEIEGVGAMAQAGQLQLLLRGAAPVTGTFGSGRIISTRLLTVLLTDDGRIFAGAVTRQVLLKTANAG